MMQTIVISMDARKLENPDLDIRYSLPERIEMWSAEAVQDNGYDYTDEQGFGLAVFRPRMRRSGGLRLWSC